MAAPVHLPQGATVTGVKARYFYNQPVLERNDLRVNLMRRAFAGDGFDVPMASLIAGHFAENGLRTMETSAITDPVIDNQRNLYWVYAGLVDDCIEDEWFCLHHPVYGVIVSYTMPGPD